jgi:Bacterial SH3 domain
MDMDKPVGQKRSRVAELVAVVALLAVGGGYFMYQHGIPSDVSSELAQNSVSTAPGTEGGAAPGNAADAISNSPAGAPQNGQSKSASLPTNDIAYVQKRLANIRSEASARGPLVGRAYKGTKLSVLNRSGKWVQVESGETNGWIIASLLGPRLP